MYSTVLPDVAMDVDPQMPMHDARAGSTRKKAQPKTDAYDEAPGLTLDKVIAGRMNGGPKAAELHSPGVGAAVGAAVAGAANAVTAPSGEFSLMKRLTDNKILTRGLIVVIVILLILLVVQIIRSRNAAAEQVAAPGERSSAALAPGPPPNQPIGPTNNQAQTYAAPQSATPVRQKIDDKTYAMLMKKSAAPAPGGATGGLAASMSKKMAAMSAFVSGRKPEDDGKRLATIVEEATTEVDPEHERQRATINELLKKEAEANAEEAAMQAAGSDIVEAAHEDVQREMAKQMNAVTAGAERIGDEALMTATAPEPLADADSESDDDVATGRVAALCDAVVASGQRAGQACMRACPNGTTKCSRHARKR